MHIYRIHEQMNDAYENHQALKEMFPTGRHLWKATSNGLLVASEKQIIPEAMDLDFVNFIGELKDKSFPRNKSFKCSVRLNPTKRGSSRKRVGLKDEAIEDYVDRKLGSVDEVGFTFLSREIRDEGKVISSRGTSKVTHRSILVRGMISVFDESKFKETIMKGIGSAKGFGFGLLDVWS